MKPATVRIGDGRQRVAAVLDGGRRMVDLGSAHELMREGESPTLASMVALIEGGDSALDLARELVEATPEEAIVDRSAAVLLAPIPVPPQIRDFLAFEQHLTGAFAMARTEVSKANATLVPGPTATVGAVSGSASTCNRSLLSPPAAAQPSTFGL